MEMSSRNKKETLHAFKFPLQHSLYGERPVDLAVFAQS
jgi:hypothetical protein